MNFLKAVSKVSAKSSHTPFKKIIFYFILCSEESYAEIIDC